MSKKATKSVPAYRIYSVTEKEDGSTAWAEIGAAFRHKDSKGFNLVFKARPLADAQVVLREPKPKKVEDTASAREAA